MARPLRLVAAPLAWGLGGLLVAVILLAFGERALWRGKVLPGVRLAGTSVAGRSLDDARRSIEARAAGLESDPVEAVTGEVAFTFTPAEVGLELDEDRAFAEVSRAGRRGNLLAQALGVVTRRLSPEEVTFAIRYDERRLAEAVDEWAATIDRQPADGNIRIESGVAVPDAPRAGRTLIRPDTRALVNRALRGQEDGPLQLPVSTTPPVIGAEEVEAALTEAKRALTGAATVTVTAEGQAARSATLTPTQIGMLLQVAAADGHLKVGLPDAAVHTALAGLLADLETPAKNARFVIDNEPVAEPAPSPTTTTTTLPPDQAATSSSTAPTTTTTTAPPPPPSVRIEESVVGRMLDIHPVAQALLAGKRQIEGRLVDRAPDIDAEKARGFRIIEPVASFTTRHPAGEPRVKNIHRIADLLQDTVIAPGARFSINETVGPRTKAKGFVKAPVIYEGEFTEDIGGGVSQFATTFFNAAFFGGYKLADYKAHTYYISRYPQGREATVSFPKPDLVIENDSSSGILVRTQYTGTTITVTFWGDKEGRTVRAEGPRVGKRTGNGYNVEVVRVIERPGKEPERQSIKTFYRSQRKATPKPTTTAPPPGGPAPAPAPAPTPPPEPVAPDPAPAASPPPA